MAFRLFEDHEPDCIYCGHMRREAGRMLCSRKRCEAVHPCGAFVYDPLKRVPRQEARLPEYRPEDFAIGGPEAQEEDWQ